MRQIIPNDLPRRLSFGMVLTFGKDREFLDCFYYGSGAS